MTDDARITPELSQNISSDLTQDEQLEALFKHYQDTRDVLAQHRLIEHHISLAYSLARRFAHRGEPLEDLNQVASIGLMNAVKRYDPDRGVSFSSFAIPTILGELKRYFRDRCWTIQVPRRIQEMRLRLDKAISSLSQEIKRPPTPAELARHMDVSEEEIIEALEAGSFYRPASLDQSLSANDNDFGSKAHMLGEEEPMMAVLEDLSALSSFLVILGERERKIVYLRYFENFTQTQIAETMNLSQMHVSRILTKSLVAMQKYAEKVRDE